MFLFVKSLLIYFAHFSTELEEFGVFFYILVTLFFFWLINVFSHVFIIYYLTFFCMLKYLSVHSNFNVTI